MLNFNQLSYWEKSIYLTDIDYLIIGSGIVGLSTAIHLKQAEPEKKVVVLERGYLPSGGSTKNAGFACIGSPSELLSDLRSGDRSPETRGQTLDEQVWKTVKDRFEGLQYLRELLGDEAIGYEEAGSFEVFRLEDSKKYRECLEYLNVLNDRIEEVTGVKENFKEDPSILDKTGMSGFCGAISIKAEGMIDTGRMMGALIKRAAQMGVLLLNGIEVINFVDENAKILRLEDSKRGVAGINTQYGPVKARKVAICTNGLTSKLLSPPKLSHRARRTELVEVELRWKRRGEAADAFDVRPVRAQVVVTSPIPNLKIKGTYHFDEGYYYFRNVGDRLLFGGGRNLDFEAEETDELNTSDQIINHLSSILETHILPNTAFTIDHHWAGTMGVGSGKSPIVEQISENVFCGVRLGGMGVAIGTSVGKSLAQLLTNR